MAETALQAQDATAAVPGPHCPTCGREMHYKDDKTKTITSCVGDLSLQRSYYYYCRPCQQGRFPLDEQLQVFERTCSERVAKLAVELCGRMTPAETETILGPVGGDGSIFQGNRLTLFAP
jgi:hypothetical protein